MNSHHESPLEKALAVNLDQQRYGTFAEIGAGQEVVRWFFRAGGAAGTIAKSISAYDMQVSDAIYGNCQRYVCRERLDAMLDSEQVLNHERLSGKRGDSTAFFSFADTVSARNFHGTNECHGWMGIRFQMEPGADDSRIIVHVRMLDPENTLQQEALGIVGVNLVYGAFFLGHDPKALIRSLVDGLGTSRIEIDMIELSGAGYEHIDNRVMALRLVQLQLTGAALFAADGTVLQPSAVLRKRPLIVERGRFRPVTHVNIDMLEAARQQFDQSIDAAPDETLPIMEITMHNLVSEGEVCLEDFISRADVLATTGYTVMISDFPEFYRLAAYLFRYTHRPIALVMGLGTLRGLFDEHYYESLEGGILESFGKLFRNQLEILVYPLKDQKTGRIETVDNVELDDALAHLFGYLRDRRWIRTLKGVNEAYLDIFSPDVLEMIGRGDVRWTEMVPESVAEAIRLGELFGYKSVESVAASR